jgi:hypothetical protein
MYDKLLSFQAQYHVARARKIDEEERNMRKKQQEEREKLKRMQLDMQREVEERRRLQKEDAVKARLEYLEKMKSATLIDEIDDKPAKKGCKFYAIIKDLWVIEKSLLAYLIVIQPFNRLFLLN